VSPKIETPGVYKNDLAQNVEKRSGLAEDCSDLEESVILS